MSRRSVTVQPSALRVSPWRSLGRPGGKQPALESRVSTLGVARCSSGEVVSPRPGRTTVALGLRACLGVSRAIRLQPRLPSSEGPDGGVTRGEPRPAREVGPASATVGSAGLARVDHRSRSARRRGCACATETTGGGTSTVSPVACHLQAHGSTPRTVTSEPFKARCAKSQPSGWGMVTDRSSQARRPPGRACAGCGQALSASG